MKLEFLKVRNLAILVMVLLTLSVFYSSPAVIKEASAQETPLLYWGTSGYHVTEVQKKLSNWGYYRGPIDGVYGGSTRTAVVKFQSYNGLKRDGLVGTNTWAALGYNVVNQEKKTAEAVPEAVDVSRLNNDSRLYLLAKVIEGEAADEPFLGKVAVGSVILNRIRSSAFPNSLSGIVYQPLAFESVSNGQYNRPLSQESIKAARAALNGWDPTYGALYFWNPYKRVSNWIWSRPIVTQIGEHVFAN